MTADARGTRPDPSGGGAGPTAGSSNPSGSPWLNGPDLPPMRELAGLVKRHARDRIDQNDLAGAWDDIVVLLRMARHTSEGATMIQASRPSRSSRRRWTSRGTGPRPGPDARTAPRGDRGLPRLARADPGRGGRPGRGDPPRTDDRSSHRRPQGIAAGDHCRCHVVEPGQGPDLGSPACRHDHYALGGAPVLGGVNRRYASDLIQMAALEPWQSGHRPGLETRSSTIWRAPRWRNCWKRI